MCTFKPRNRGKNRDECMKDVLAGLAELGMITEASCCGHGVYPPTVIARDPAGRHVEIFSGTVVPRKKRFYRRDATGMYYIPEVAGRGPKTSINLKYEMKKSEGFLKSVHAGSDFCTESEVQPNRGGGGDPLTRYIPAFSWTGDIEKFLHELITEKPLLNVCAGKSPLGDVKVDRYEAADFKADMTRLPFENDSFAAVFCDPPWDATVKTRCAEICKEAMRVAPILYLMAPWVWGTSTAGIEQIWVRHFPGVHNPILLVKYTRKLKAQDYAAMKAADLSAFGVI